MTPQEKAGELFRKMYEVRSVAASDITKHFAKQSALIAVDEIINALNDDQSTLGLYENGVAVTDKSFWQEVKQELENL